MQSRPEVEVEQFSTDFCSLFGFLFLCATFFGVAGIPFEGAAPGAAEV